MSTTKEIVKYWISVICVLISASVVRAGEYCTYTKSGENQITVRTTYCEGYCCEENEDRCCEYDYTGLYIGCIIAGCVFLLVVIMIVVVLCKRSANMKRARIRNNQASTNTQTPAPPCYGQHNIFLIQPPPYSYANNNGQWQAPPPPAYPGVPDGTSANNANGPNNATGGGPMGGAFGGPMGGASGSSYNKDEFHVPPPLPLYQKEKPSISPPAYSYK